jgi:hypothetical protein
MRPEDAGGTDRFIPFQRDAVIRHLVMKMDAAVS